MVIIDAPAFETQYSPRLGEATSALTEVIVTMERATGPSGSGGLGCRIIRRATAWVRKKGPRRLTLRQRS